jgi:hypothetical protein
MEKLTILAENFRECVRLCQQCVLWAIGTAFSSLLIVFQMRALGDAGLALGQVQVDVLFSHLRLPTAWILASAIFVLLGTYAAYATNQARRNILKLAELGGKDLADCARMYPSPATADEWFMRRAPVFIAPIFMVGSWILEIAREKGIRSWKDENWGAMIVLGLILLLPYIVLLMGLWHPIGWLKEDKKPNAKGANQGTAAGKS